MHHELYSPPNLKRDGSGSKSESGNGSSSSSTNSSNSSNSSSRRRDSWGKSDDTATGPSSATATARVAQGTSDSIGSPRWCEAIVLETVQRNLDLACQVSDEVK